MSPYLFILTTNVLSYMIDKSVSNNVIHDIMLNKQGPRLTHCLFVDDIICSFHD
ncbi:hypothetical protein LINPERPRIM_LOCUS6630 [Linum perenne]